ncbi:HK97 family phage prohead protease [Streptomyces sp. NBC_00378]|uniref:HK97 family phage prohead protease n=1 Tax=unclassified Streptomyces TaxID=2593676 RepID=UPI0022576C7F|nr:MULTISPECIES: HK97 family phage prohead protease [unclassified Streptomyces]MCX5112205.1 HK97 family phage prohead protease [Streptomyces sp. NBC_00378]MCX5114600.1 HK97 family phage prohead protease [Streptomyces sp. NBC_00378]
MNEAERRFTRGLVEVRAAGETRTIGGYAAKFNTLSRNLGGFVERIDPGFFAKSEGDGWPRVMARYNHDNNMLLGTSRSGTLRLITDGTGLDYSVDVPAARADVYELVQRGDVAESSFAFRTLADDWSMTEDGFPVRTLLAGQLVDVAPVNDPAYLDTSTGLRSLAERAGAELEEVRAAAAAGDLKPFVAPQRTMIDLAPTGGQGDTHPPLALRQRRAELYRRRTF